MPLSWNEIKTRAVEFSKEWENETSEDAEAKSFWDGFFNVFGIGRKRVASFETKVKKLDGKDGFIDLLWKGVVLVEHKSGGKSLDKAYKQAKDYFPGLKEHELPKYILVSNFQNFRLYDLESNATVDFPLNELIRHVQLFGFIAGYEKRTYKEEDPANIEAAERMGKLHDALEASGYTGHALEVYLVRLLFCLFAEDTSIFERTQFQDYIDRNTKEDGSDLAMHLALLFQVLNTPLDKRLNTLDETLTAFPYVNGKLFEEMLPFAAFNSKMRDMLLYAAGLDWSKISPAIFGSMFQAVMNPKERRNLGAHYTSEKNIQKVIRPLFLDELHSEFEKAKGNKRKLNEFHEKISGLTFLDPACGCGNFLIISYRELRQLEIEILRELNKSGQGFIDVKEIIRVDVDQFSGIEYDEFPARIAEVAMWLIDHQMNMKVSEEFGQYFVRLPIQKSAKVLNGNALRLNWSELYPQNTYDVRAGKVNIIQATEPVVEYEIVNIYAKEVNVYPTGGVVESEPTERFFNYILGNPPFIGKHLQNESQKTDMESVFAGVQGAGVLDYVAAWYFKAAQYIQNTKTKVAFVSTNSISQGEQVSILWNVLFNLYKVKIHFAHRTFSWTNEAKGNAAVHCVIIGFAGFDVSSKLIYDYSDIKGESTERAAKNINPYLAEGTDLVVSRRSQPLEKVSPMRYGSKPTDGGFLLLTDAEKEEYCQKEPEGLKFIHPFISAKEFLNGEKRWCFWLIDLEPHALKKMPLLYHRIEGVRKMRLESTKLPTKKLAQFPTQFGEIRQPESDYIVVPLHSSENRNYIPIGFFSRDSIVANSCSCIPNASLFLFGMLTSLMHMAWVKTVCGRIKSDFRYSSDFVYNNFPFPRNVSESMKRKVEEAAQDVLAIRQAYPNSSLADLYDPLSMPPNLVKAHQILDKAVDQCYRSQPFTTELNRLEFLFGLYELFTAPLFEKRARKKSK
ncbi:MAG TPA: class I SAM-dependent DNA methyltransferase [Catalimonadaceae bacterium]|nr:class I SAM-dependent DNA methyltransferase [Catalimonadaceae bacterium]HPI11145.1 class I SAM-dependent DNA methyltransferase [Catalimonadaceae bacterium]